MNGNPKRTLNFRDRVPLTKAERAELPGLLLDIADYRRPRTRGECGTERPCPWVSCKYNLYLDVRPTGSIKINWLGDIEDMPESCVLDLADRGGLTLESVGAMLDITRERIRQVEASALEKLKSQLTEWRDDVNMTITKIPAPHAADLRKLEAFVDEATSHGGAAQEWWQEKITELLRDAISHLAEGRWSEAERRAKMARTTETQYSKKEIAEGFLTALSQLKAKYSHDVAGEIQKKSLREELPIKKQPKKEKATHASMLRQLPDPDPKPPANVCDSLGDGQQGDATRGLCSLPAQVQPIQSSVSDGALQRLPEGPQRGRSKGRQETLSAAQVAKVRDDFWDAIISRDKTKIVNASKAVVEAKLKDVVEECALQMVRQEVPALKEVRRWALEAMAGT
jgi:hypothetical protein